jgi:adenylate kinase family enzyme
MIIIEGANGVGKSTLIKKLIEQLPELEYYKVALTKETAKQLNFKWYLKQTQLLKRNYIVDRWHLGQIVYPQLYKDGRKPLKLKEQYLLEQILLNIGTILVYCYASEGFIKNVYNTRGKQWQTISMIKPELQLFSSAISTSIMPIIHYSPEMPNEVQKSIIDKILINHINTIKGKPRCY